MADIVDLRGRGPVPVPASVLADPSGRRARVLARLGRGISLVMLMWVIGLVLAGVGVLPADDLPLGPAVSSDDGAKALRALPPGAPPARSDLRPALAAARAPVAASSGSTSLPRHRNATHGIFARLGHPGRSTAVVGSGRGRRPPAISTPPGRGQGVGGAGGAAGSLASAGVSSGNRAALATPTANGGGSTTHGHAPTKRPASTPSDTPGAAPGRVNRAARTPITTSPTPGNSASAPGRRSPRGNHYGDGG
jgi:hypothetical protein